MASQVVAALLRRRDKTQAERAALRERWEPVAREAARRHGIPEQLFVRQITAESDWNPDARGGFGEIGLGQILPRTGTKELGFRTVEEMRDSARNLDGAARYLAKQYERFGSWEKALAAYNAGPGSVQAVQVPRHTQRYVREITSEAPWERTRGEWERRALARQRYGIGRPGEP